MSGAAYRDIDIVVSCVAIGVIGSQMEGSKNSLVLGLSV